MSAGVRFVLWSLVALLGALALATIAFHRGEQINALWLVAAAVCTYALGYRFYSGFIAAKVLALDPQRATPAERLENGRDFLPTNKWVVFGHHFAAIAGPGTAGRASAGGTIWLSPRDVVDFSRRGFWRLRAGFRDSAFLRAPRREISDRNGESRNWARRRGGGLRLSDFNSGYPARGLRVDRGERAQAKPVGDVHHRDDHSNCVPDGRLFAATAPRARAGNFGDRIPAGTGGDIGRAVGFAESGGGEVLHYDRAGARDCDLIYGFAASALPVWLLLAPRDYLSTFVKLGTIGLLVIGNSGDASHAAHAGAYQIH